MHLGDLVLKKFFKTSGVKLKSSQKLSFPGGLKNSNSTNDAMEW